MSLCDLTFFEIATYTLCVHKNSQRKGEGKKMSKKSTMNFGCRGWVIIFMCLIAYYIGGGINTDGLNIFVGALSGARGWDRAAMLTWSTYGGWIGIVLSLLFGHLTVKKKNGAKYVLVGSLLVTAVAFYFYGHTQSYGVYALCVGTCAAFACGYSLVSPNVIQTNWFPKKKAMVLGISTIGFPLCTMTFPALSDFLIGAVGLEGMFTVISVCIAVFAILCLFICKVTPEEVGAYPDNEPVEAERYEAQKKEMMSYQSPWTIRKLAKEKMFWLSNVGLGLMWMVTVAIVSQLVARLMSAGYDQKQAVAMLSVMGFFGIFGSYIWGWIDQKTGTKKAALIYCIWYIIALVLLIFMANTITVYLAVFMVGTSVGGICNLIPSMTGTLFGRKDFAAANRFASPITSGIKACAFLFVAQSMRLTGSLTGAYVGLIIVCVVAFLLLSQIKPLKQQ